MAGLFPFFFLTHSLSTGLFNNQFPIVLTIEYLQWASNSVYYLLSLWSRLVTSVPYLKGDTPSMLDETVPKITEGFITSRINSVQVLISNEMMELLSISDSQLKSNVCYILLFLSISGQLCKRLIR